jgi:hypothetical protein
MEGLASGAREGRSCKAVVAPDLRSDLMLARSGRHFIIYTISPTDLFVREILHQSMNVTTRLCALDAP